MDLKLEQQDKEYSSRTERKQLQDELVTNIEKNSHLKSEIKHLNEELEGKNLKNLHQKQKEDDTKREIAQLELQNQALFQEVSKKIFKLNFKVLQ